MSNLGQFGLLPAALLVNTIGNPGFTWSSIYVQNIITGGAQVTSSLVITGELVLSTATTTGALVFAPDLASTTIGLGTSRYVSSPSLTSTTIGLSQIGYVSSSALVSTTNAIQASGYLSTPVLQSTVVGLSNINYVVNSQLTSTAQGLAGINYVSTNSLVSSLRGLGSYGYVSSSGLASTTQGLGSLGYLSTGGNLNSALISSQQLITSSIGVNRNNISFPLDVIGSSRMIGNLQLGSATNVSSGTGVSESPTLLLQFATDSSAYIRNMSTTGSLFLGASNTNYLEITSNGAFILSNTNASGEYFFSESNDGNFNNIEFGGPRGAYIDIKAGPSAGNDRDLRIGYFSTNSYIELVGSSRVSSINLMPAAGSATNGRVGILTNTPGYTLDVNGTTNASITRAGQRLYISGVPSSNFPTEQGTYISWNNSGGDGVTYIYNNPGAGGGGFKFRNLTSAGAFSNEPLTILGNGYVGINCNAPIYPFDVNTSSFTLGAHFNFSGSNSDDNLYLTNSFSTISQMRIIPRTSAAGNWNTLTQLNDSAIIFGAGGTSSIGFVLGPWSSGLRSNMGLRMDSNGNVGIGISAPTSRLHVYSGGNSNAELKVTANDSYTSRLGLYEDSNGATNGGYMQYNGGTGILDFGVRTTGTDATTFFVSNDWVSVKNALYIGNSNNTIGMQHNGTNAFIRSQVGPLYLGGANTSNVITLTGSALGVGLSNPSYTFHAAGVSYIASTLLIGNALSTNCIKFSGTNGDTGTGSNFNTTIIAERIYAASENAELLFFKGNDNTGPSGPDRVRVAATGGFVVDIASNTTLWNPDTTPGGPPISLSSVLLVTDTGRVGIGGNNSPSQTLDVNGNTRVLGNVQIGAPGNTNTGTAAAPSATFNLSFGSDGNSYLRHMSTTGYLYMGAGNQNTITVTNTQRMGIGVDPLQVLDVAGVARTQTGVLIAGNTNANGAAGSPTLIMQFAGDSSSYIRNMSTNGYLYLGAGNQNTVTITNTQRMGIGVDPQSLLHTHSGAANNELKITTNDGYTSRVGMFEESSSSNGTYMQYTGSDNTTSIGIRRNAVDYNCLQIDTLGKVSFPYGIHSGQLLMGYFTDALSGGTEVAAVPLYYETGGNGYNIQNTNPPKWTDTMNGLLIMGAPTNRTIRVDLYGDYNKSNFIRTINHSVGYPIWYTFFTGGGLDNVACYECYYV